MPSVVKGGAGVKLFADDVKMYSVVGDDKSNALFSAGLDSITQWSQDWQLPI